jgi:hypothetical protein
MCGVSSQKITNLTLDGSEWSASHSLYIQGRSFHCRLTSKLRVSAAVLNMLNLSCPASSEQLDWCDSPELWIMTAHFMLVWCLIMSFDPEFQFYNCRCIGLKVNKVERNRNRLQNFECESIVLRWITVCLLYSELCPTGHNLYCL